MEQRLHFYFDDSGVLHKNAPINRFIYAGYVFVDDKEKEEAKRKYKALNKKIRREEGRDDEIKACNTCKRHKRALYNVLREYESLSVVVRINHLYDYILSDKKSICRYKDYILKRLIKEKAKEIISKGLIDSDVDTQILINIDEQLTASNGYYNLKESIQEELKFGIYNYDYGKMHPNVFNGDLDIVIKYCESKNDYLIQASDILANRIFSSYKYNQPNLRNGMPNHKFLTMP